jgi:hypothetical protein
MISALVNSDGDTFRGGITVTVAESYTLNKEGEGDLIPLPFFAIRTFSGHRSLRRAVSASPVALIRVILL